MQTTGTPTDQAWIESLFTHDPVVLRAELDRVRVEYNTVRLHAGVGYVTPTTNTAAADHRSARLAARACIAPAASGLGGIPCDKREHPRHYFLATIEIGASRAR